jgi:hemerythrin-like domain-containing protein
MTPARPRLGRMSDRGRGRREFLAGVVGTGVVLAADGARAAPAHAKKGAGEDIPPTEDLMREHGVLRRILLVYDEAVRRLATDDPVAGGAVAGAAGIVRRFVEGYHEKLEEELVLPKLEKAGKLVQLAKVIRAQHAAGRRLTDAIAQAAKAADGKRPGAEQRRAIVVPIQSFTRMYTAHAAWEDTELFPAYRALFTEAELDKLGERFEEQEHKLLGSAGFERSLKEVGDLETALGIHDLAAFSPR